MNKKQRGFAFIKFWTRVSYPSVIFIGIIGYCMNIYKLTKYDFEKPYKSEVIRGIGIVVPPMGAVTGFLKVKDK